MNCDTACKAYATKFTLDIASLTYDRACMIHRYTLANYMRIVTYKTAYYSFYLPVACGMVLSGIKDEAAYKLAEKICVEMGQYFQVG